MVVAFGHNLLKMDILLMHMFDMSCAWEHREYYHNTLNETQKHIK